MRRNGTPNAQAHGDASKDGASVAGGGDAGRTRGKIRQRWKRRSGRVYAYVTQTCRWGAESNLWSVAGAAVSPQQCHVASSPAVFQQSSAQGRPPALLFF